MIDPLPAVTRTRRAIVAAAALLMVLSAPSAAPSAKATAAGATAAGATAAASAGPGSALRGSAVAVDHHPAGTFDLTAGWRFALVNTVGTDDPDGAYADAARPDFPDAGWRAVHLPHDWSIELNPTDGPATTAGTGFYQGGLGWYRKSFTLGTPLAGTQLSVEFDGVYMDSEVYFNGRLIGGHHYGYTGFSLPLTGAHTDGRTPNVLAVKVRNAIPSSRWYSGSGIYRNVRLVATEAVHVQRQGMVVTTPDLERTAASGYGIARVATTIAATTIAGAGGSPVAVTSTVRDAAGRAVGAAATTVPAGAAPVTATVDVRVPRPRRWDLSDPYLYSVTTQLAVGGRVVDTYVSRTGFRTLRFDPQAGFFLNGRAVKLQGVNLHHDLGALGAVVNRDAMVRQLTIMKSMGVNALRTSHNPPAPELVRLCEELGIVMMVEAFDVWNVAKTPNDYARFFPTDADADLAEMVRQARNSPAVIMWSIGNEIPNSRQADAVPIARRLIDGVRALDPTRPVVIGSDKYRSVPAAGSPLAQILLMLDGVGLNYNTAGSVDALHAAYPRQFFFESESSSETSTRGRYDQPEQLNTGENLAPGRRAASSYDNNLASWTMSGEYSLKKDRDRPWFLGQFLWSGIDYIGEPTPFDVFPVKASLFGAVDTAGFAKDQFYLFQSRWTRRPMVHLLPMTWTGYRPGETVRVWAYTNADTVELSLNGRSLGVRRFDTKTTADGRAYRETTEATGDDRTVRTGAYPGSYTGTDGTAGRLHLAWDVPYRAGRLTAVARQGGREIARDELRTAGPAAAVRLTADRRVTTADGRSLAFVTADVVDRGGTLVPDAENLLRFSVRGGRLVGVDNGRQESAESYRAPYRTAFHGKALAVVTATGVGPVTVTATGDGLRTGSATVLARPAAPGDASRQGQAPPAFSTPNAPTTPVPAVAPGVDGLTADASFAGSELGMPATMVDGVTATGGWTNSYSQDGTALLAPVSAARPTDWVSVAWSPTRTVSGMTARFVLDARRTRPAAVSVQAFDGVRWRPVTGTRITWATASGEPSTITFDPVTATKLRLELTSAKPQAPDGFVGITELALLRTTP